MADPWSGFPQGQTEPGVQVQGACREGLAGQRVEAREGEAAGR